MNNTKKIVLAALLLAMGLVLPPVFHIFGPNASSLFSPMHIPTFFAGFLLGPLYGALVGVLTPLISSLVNGMPPLMPIGVSMMVEIGIYGLVCGLFSKKYPILIVLVFAIILGRVGYVTMSCFVQGINVVSIWWTNIIANFTGGIFTIILQLILIPLLVPRIEKVIDNSNH